MIKFDVVQRWFDNVAYSHSRSLQAESYYRYALNLFCKFIEKSPNQSVTEYEKSLEREFRRKYASFVGAFISSLERQGLAIGSVNAYVVVIRGFGL